MRCFIFYISVVSGIVSGKMACVRRLGNGWKCWMNGVRLCRSIGLKASACSFVKNQDFKWHTSTRLYSAFTFTRPVSFMPLTFAVDKWFAVVRVPSVATPVAPSTAYKCMKYNANKLTLKLTLALTLNPNLNTNPIPIPLTPYFLRCLVCKLAKADCVTSPTTHHLSWLISLSESY